MANILPWQLRKSPKNDNLSNSRKIPEVILKVEIYIQCVDVKPVINEKKR